MFNSIQRAIRLSRQRSREENALPFSRQLWEMARLQLTTKLGPGNYHKYRLWQKDIPWEEKKGYWHDQKYYEFLNRVNPYKYRIVARHKVLAKALLQFYGIPDARYLGYLNIKSSFASDGRAINTTEALESWLTENSDLKRMCFKPVEGSGGDGFCAVELIRGDTLMLQALGKNTVKSLEDFIAQDLNGLCTTDYIMEEYVEQHPVLAEFNPSSLNTVRVWVGKTASKGTNIVGIYLRVGRQGSLVDNRLSGGFGVEVDQDTFKTKAAIPQDGGGQAFKGHPDSGFDMTDIELPFKSEVIELSKRVINILPSTSFVGLDIAFSTNGPVIIEFNLAPTAIGACVLQKSHQQLLSWILDD
ncbi:sugar-transfer associated ATP-grasp domain-containing protein [Lacimicrobium alkaliphilum]|uniref:Alpha-L-glutamate ligase-related protein ATP-grasp domain-containing protein n=1 Tax=Lacimicrobium alkaliphilum TaxID=1526571 RepID=A0ABQ1RJC0_9ALTE|nr:sugar-transfer associated ATP-grasp domain-containing protein [Lacimicrobium alkaliphilum]GGD68960.1 hypothetical protein GCM10011357_25030 [Lacimicrobium alkaliphilum]